MSIFDQALLMAKNGATREQIKESIMESVDRCVDVIERDYQNEIVEHQIRSIQSKAKIRILSREERDHLLNLMIRVQ